METQDPPGAIGIFISAAHLRYGSAGAAWFAFLWYLTAPLVLVRPFVYLWRKAANVLSGTAVAD